MKYLRFHCCVCGGGGGTGKEGGRERKGKCLRKESERRGKEESKDR